MNINLHIERLVLDGISVEPHHQQYLKAVVEAELGSLLLSTGLSSDLQSVTSSPVISAGLISIENNLKPASLGQQIGNAVHRGIG